MTSVTQKIPNLIGGISQQPDELMPLGSVRDAVNVVPDVTNGLSKRPGGRLLNPLTTDKNGTWFHINRDSNEQYVGHVKPNGTVEVYDLLNNGLPQQVLYSSTPFDIYNDNVEEEDEDAVPAYPSCDWDKVQQELFAWTETQRQIDVKEEELTLLIAQQEEYVPPGEERVYYDVDRISSNLYSVNQGWIQKSGDDILEGPTLPSGWEYRKGEEKESNVSAYPSSQCRTNEDTGRGQDCSPTYNNVNIHELVYFEPGQGVDNSERIAELEDELSILKQTVEGQYESYYTEVANCGGQAIPNEYRLVSPRNEEEELTDQAPAYLVHNEIQGIETLTINDFTFFANPDPYNFNTNSTPTLDKNDEELRPYENYIEVTVGALNKEYTLFIVEGDEEADDKTDTRVVKLGIQNQLDNGWTDDDASCGFNGSDEYLIQGTDLEVPDVNKVNLRIRVTTTGTQYLPENKDGTDPNDFKCKYNTTVDVLNSGSGFQVGDQFTIELSGRDYLLKINEVEEYTINNVDAVIRPTIITGDGSTTVRVEDILTNIKDAIEAYDPTMTTDIIGNGVYVARGTDKEFFSFSTPETAIMNVVTSEVNNVSNLPTSCKDGMIVKVANTESDFDDYWAKFHGTETGVDGSGAWEECAIPGGYHYINPNTMPHAMRRVKKGEFVVSPINWEQRQVGDDNTNPPPTFIGQKINKMILFRNRLGLLSDENVILSQSGFFTNFWNGSALAQVDNDPIDISAASTQPAILFDAIEVAAGLLCFSQNQQHLLSTDSEVFGPNTARFNMVGTYRCSNVADVVSLGSTVAFINNSGLYSRAIELTNIDRSTQSQATEISKPVSRLMPSNLDRVADSQDNNFIMYSAYDSQDVWLYRYFDDDGQRRQSAWFRWNFPGKLLYHCIIDDVYYTVTYSYNDASETLEEVVALQRYDLKETASTSLVKPTYQNARTPFETHLDNYRVAYPSDLTYYEHLDETYFKAPIVYYEDRKLVAYALSPTVAQEDYGIQMSLVGSAIDIKVEIDNQGTWFVFPGNWANSRLMIGYEFEMKVDFPTLYVSKTSAGVVPVTSTNTRGHLTVHRVNLNFGQSGVFNTRLTRLGREDYEEMYECKTMDTYLANEVAFDERKTQVIPVFSRNVDFALCLSSSHPSPATVYSMEWEGSFTNDYYRSV